MAVERIIGVDFGTSTSVIRVKRYQNGKPLGEKLDTKGVIFGNGMGEMVPTLIQRKDDDESVAYYGYAAQQKRRKHTTSHSFKVDLESSEPDKRALARKLTEEFFAFMGKQYRDQSDGGHLGSADDRERTIISYPVKWSEETKQFMIAAAKKAGFPNVSGMDEAQAAIHAVTVMSEDHLRKNNLLVNGKSSNILLIDMGAGTTDLVLCRHTPDAAAKTEILTTWPKSGEILFGGRKVDHLLQGFFRDVMKPEDLAGALKSIGVDQFKAWKENSVSPALAKNDAVTDFFALDNYADIVGIEMDEYSLDRAGFEKCLGDYLKQLPELINGCLNSAEMNGSDVDLVIVTGGHSQWYFVHDILTGKKPQFGAVDLSKIKENPSRIIPITRPQETVALGLVYSPIQRVFPAPPSPKPTPNSIYTPENEFEISASGNHLRITRYTGSRKVVHIPPVICGKRVCAIEEGAFQENCFINKVIIPVSITRIGHGAFRGCRKLSCVVAHDKIERIEAYAFENCILLNDLSFGMGNCDQGSLRFPPNLLEIGDGAFMSTNLSEKTYYDIEAITVSKKTKIRAIGGNQTVRVGRILYYEDEWEKNRRIYNGIE